MGYAAEKKREEKRKKKAKNILFFVVAIVLAALIVFACIVTPNTWKFYVALPNTGTRAEGEMRIHFLDVGQGDATIIELPDGKTFLIDGGDGKESTETALMRYLNALQVETIDYLLVTHADADHCGALDSVLAYKQVKQAFIPFVKETVNEEYASFYAALMQENCSVSYASRSVDLSSTESTYPYTLSFLYPYTVDVSGEMDDAAGENNDGSAVVWLDYNGVSTLFTGDAPSAVEEKLVWDHKMGLLPNVALTSTEILKVAHHGSEYSTSLEFLEYIHAQTAVISCGLENAYGHPAPTVLDNLTEKGNKVYRTDLDGSIVITVPQEWEKSTVRKLGK